MKIIVFYVVTFHFKFNQCTQSTLHKFKIHVPSKKSILFKIIVYEKEMEDIKMENQNPEKKRALEAAMGQIEKQFGKGSVNHLVKQHLHYI